jgi:hypothetical protein
VVIFLSFRTTFRHVVAYTTVVVYRDSRIECAMTMEVEYRDVLIIASFVLLLGCNSIFPVSKYQMRAVC